MHDKENNLTNNNPMILDRFVKNSCTIAGIQDDNLASKFQLDDNYESIDNIFSILSNNIGINTSLSRSVSSEIDQYVSDIEDHHDNVNELTLEHNNSFIIHNHENIIEEVNRGSIDIQQNK